MVHAHSHMEGLAKLLPQAGRDEQPALGVNIMCILSGHGCSSFNGFLWETVGLHPTNVGTTPTSPHFMVTV